MTIEAIEPNSKKPYIKKHRYMTEGGSILEFRPYKTKYAVITEWIHPITFETVSITSAPLIGFM